MKLNANGLLKRLSTLSGFSRSESLGENSGVVRAERRFSNNPFAVYYFDLNQDLPKTKDHLTQYQDRVIGKQYFDGRKNLQWSNYLYFVVDSSQFQNGSFTELKNLVEGDRNYARKFVVREDELDEILNPKVASPTSVAPQENILLRWTKILEKAGIEDVIFCDESLPNRLDRIESPPVKTAARIRNAKSQSQIIPTQFLSAFQILKYRDFPRKREYEFGKVNLIYGANGCGKTSLLETIELFYCGRNRRNPNVDFPYVLEARFIGSAPVKVCDDRDVQVLRNCNKEWYGQRDIKTNTLYQSFAQFNFLNTDAARDLAADGDDGERSDEDLSKLLVGPEVAKTWDDIQRVHDATVSKVKELTSMRKGLKDEKAEVEKLLKQFSDVKVRSDAIWCRVEEMVKRMGWKVSQTKKLDFVEELLEAVSEFDPLVSQAVDCSWVGSPVSLKKIEVFLAEFRLVSQKLSTLWHDLGSLLDKEKELQEDRKQNDWILKLTVEAKNFLEVGLAERLAAVAKLNKMAATQSKRLAGINAAVLGKVLAAYSNTELIECHRRISDSIEKSKGLVAKAKADYENFKKMQEMSVSLEVELRNIAQRILQNSANPDECPLCHQQYERGELRLHIAGQRRQISSAGEKLLEQLQSKEKSHRQLSSEIEAAKAIRTFCERAGMKAGVSVEAALKAASATEKDYAETRERLAVLTTELKSLENRGYSAERLGEIQEQLDETGPDPIEWSLDSVNSLHSRKKQNSVKWKTESENLNKRTNALQAECAKLLSTNSTDVKAIKTAMSQIDERLAVAQSLWAHLSEVSSKFSWPPHKSLSELGVEFRAIGEVAAQYQETLNQEKRAKDVFAESKKRMGEIDGKLEIVRVRASRFTEARETLDDIISNESLPAAMDKSLKQSRSTIESIFSHIHSPQEFSGIGESLKSLIRNSGGKPATLSQISTGQRAAFALSIFLAQNALVKNGPPVILIDDPVAHVDDLNSLSFLDYLREVVIKGNRQIFFATASSKLAGLFERKFDFLGTHDFRKIELVR